MITTRPTVLLTALAATHLGVGPLQAGNSTIAPDAGNAWSANVGWIKLRPNSADGVVVGERFLSGRAWSANAGWIDLGSGAPANGFAYQNNSATDFGVNHDGSGLLNGYAYGANIGWIHFGWAAPDDPNRPRIDLRTGRFLGFAYGANIGWINLAAASLATESINIVDSDLDGIADSWEFANFGNLTTAGPGTDSDGDGRSDLDEYLAGTDPHDPASFLSIVSQSYNATRTQASLTFGTTHPARLYRIQSSPNLTANSWTFLTEPFGPASGNVTTRSVTFPAGPSRFFRVVVLQPLQP